MPGCAPAAGSFSGSVGSATAAGRAACLAAAGASSLLDKTGLAAEAPGFVEQAPGENGRMIEIALDGFAHHRFEALRPSGVSPPSPKFGKSAISSMPSLSAQ